MKQNQVCEFISGKNYKKLEIFNLGVMSSILLSLFLAHMSTQLQHHWFIDNSWYFSKKVILECWKKKLMQFQWKKREKQHKDLHGAAMCLHPQKWATNGFTIWKIGFTTYLFYPYWKTLTYYIAIAVLTLLF